MKFFISFLEKKSVGFSKPCIKPDACEGACSSSAYAICSETREDNPPGQCSLLMSYFLLLLSCVHAEIRTQLVEQFKCLEQQSESRLQLLQDLQEFFRRKAEIELEYSRSLEKLAERFSSKIRSSREHQFK